MRFDSVFEKSKRQSFVEPLNKWYLRLYGMGVNTTSTFGNDKHQILSNCSFNNIHNYILLIK